MLQNAAYVRFLFKLGRPKKTSLVQHVRIEQGELGTKSKLRLWQWHLLLLNFPWQIIRHHAVSQGVMPALESHANMNLCCCLACLASFFLYTAKSWTNIVTRRVLQRSSTSQEAPREQSTHKLEVAWMGFSEIVVVRGSQGLLEILRSTPQSMSIATRNPFDDLHHLLQFLQSLPMSNSVSRSVVTSCEEIRPRRIYSNGGDGCVVLLVHTELLVTRVRFHLFLFLSLEFSSLIGAVDKDNNL